MKNDTCDIGGCNKPGKSRGLCPTHYSAARKANALPPAKVRVPTGNPCLVEGCSRMGKTAGLCGMHYARVRKTGEAGSADSLQAHRSPRQADGLCFCDGCDRKQGWGIYCHTHGMQMYRDGAVRPIKRKNATRGTCVMPNCAGLIQGQMLCSTHYQRARRYNLSAVQLMHINAQRNCDICGKHQEEILRIDHDHSCCDRLDRQITSCGGCIRGLLCQGCNTALGHFYENPATLTSAIAYLGGALLAKAA